MRTYTATLNGKPATLPADSDVLDGQAIARKIARLPRAEMWARIEEVSHDTARYTTDAGRVVVLTCKAS